jgi:hypothetical protein
LTLAVSDPENEGADGDSTEAGGEDKAQDRPSLLIPDPFADDEQYHGDHRTDGGGAN